jgi:RNA polymerase sigma factor (sigma-70 family)
MVRRVCESILVDPHDAADAFQATFLVLARRAHTVRKADSVGPWLFGVARRVALRTRTASARRRRVESAAGLERPAAAPCAPPADRHAPLLQELDRLPARYRDPLILCYLEGLSHEQAALRIGCRLTTFRTRLARGKNLLRDRLARRGLSSTLLVGLLRPGPPTLPLAWTAAARLAFSGPGAALGSPAGLIAAAVCRSLACRSIAPIVAAGAFAVAGFAIASPLSHEVARPAPAPAPSVATFICPSDTTIETLLPEGSPVLKGQTIAALDIQALRRQLADQMAATDRARAELDAARAATDRLAALEASITAESLELVAPAEPAPALALRRARLDLLRAEVALERAEIEARAPSDLAEKKRALDAAMAKEAGLRSQIESCSFVAPHNGVVRHATAGVAPGFPVQAGQTLLRCEPSTAAP